MKSITGKLVVGMLASLAALGMTGGAAFADQPISEARDEAVDSSRDGQGQAGYLMKHPQSVTGKVLWRVSYARAAAGNVAREAQRQGLEVLDSTH